MRISAASASDELGVLWIVRDVDLEQLGTDIVLFHEVPVGLGHLIRVEERLVVAVGEPLTDARRVDLAVDDDVRDVDSLGGELLIHVHRHPAGGELRGREPDHSPEAPYRGGRARKDVDLLRVQFLLVLNAVDPGDIRLIQIDI